MGSFRIFFPLVGLILFLVWLKDKKKAAKAAGMESYQNDPRYKVYRGVKTCDIKDIDAALELYKVDDFPIEKSYTFYNVDGSISNSNPRISTSNSIKQYFNQTCKR